MIKFKEKETGRDFILLYTESGPTLGGNYNAGNYVLFVGYDADGTVDWFKDSEIRIIGENHG